MKKEIFTAIVISAFLISLTTAICSYPVRADSVDFIYFDSGVTIYSPLNMTYSYNNLVLNLSLRTAGFLGGLDPQISMNYKIDNIQSGSVPLKSDGELHVQTRAVATVALPKLPEGSHNLTISLYGLNQRAYEPKYLSYENTVYFAINLSNSTPTATPTPSPSPTPNPSPPSWVAKAPMPTARFSFGVATVNGKIYAIGGAVNYSSALLAVNEEYDPIADKWSKKAPMPTPTYGVAVAVYENRIYVFGEAIDNNSTLTDATLVYDPSTDSWATKAPMPIARNSLQANVVGDKIYLIGGYPYPNATLTEVYDPAMDTWTTKAPIPIPVIAYASAVVDNKIYIISGASFENATSPAAVLSSTQVYDPKTDTWSSGTPIPTPIDSAGVGVIIDAEGRKAIYVVGGETDIFSPQSTVQIYFPENNSWSIGSSLPTSRSRLCVAVVNNALYAIGGTRIIGHQGLSENEQYSLIGTVLTGSPSPSPSSSISPSIPEFPSWIFPLLFIASTLTVIELKTKFKPKLNECFHKPSFKGKRSKLRRF